MKRLAMLVLAFALSACGSDTPTGPSATIVPSAQTLIWTRSGTGNNVLDKPAAVTRLRILGTFSGASSNFIIWCGTNLLVNELLGTSWGPLRYEGTHSASGCTEVRVENSTGVAWSLTEVR